MASPDVQEIDRIYDARQKNHAYKTPQKTHHVYSTLNLKAQLLKLFIGTDVNLLDTFPPYLLNPRIKPLLLIHLLSQYLLDTC